MTATRTARPVRVNARQPSRAPDPSFVVRDAAPADNAQLIELSAACPMAGDITLRMDRGPDFFALNRLEGDRCQVAVAESGGRVVGCIAISERQSFVNGDPMSTGYVGDLKVHPAYRDTRIADALSHHAYRACGALPPSAPVMITVLAGNRAMERRLSGPRGVPAFRKIGTIRTHSIPILWERSLPRVMGCSVEAARWSDLDEMIGLWAGVCSRRQLAPVLTANRLAAWIRSAPGLDIGSYRIARSPSGAMLGFLAVWDQRSFKQLTVVGYSPRMKLMRSVFNAAAAVVGAERLPDAGFPLNCATAAHICVPPSRPDVLRALLLSAYQDLRRSRCAFLNVGLDRRDLLKEGVDGLLAQPTDVDAYVVASRAGVCPEPLDDRTLHYEIGLV